MMPLRIPSWLTMGAEHFVHHERPERGADQEASVSYFSIYTIFVITFAATACSSVDDSQQSFANIVDEGMNEDELTSYSPQAIRDYIQAKGSGPTDLTSNAAAGAPNIVVFVADDLPRGLLGFEANPAASVKTPNIDALREGGVAFSRFYLPIGQCAPSHSVLWTGLFPTQSGVQTNGHVFTDQSTEVLPKRLRDHGYRTGFFGKCHIGTENPGTLDADWEFDAIFHTEGGSALQPDTIDMYNSRTVHRKNVSQAVPGVHFTKSITDKAIEFVAATEEPFFAWIAHRAPHHHSLKITGPNGQWRNAPPGAPRYRVEDMPNVLSPEKANDRLAHKPPQQKNSPSSAFKRRLEAEPGGMREYIRRAHEQMDFLDQQVGRFLGELERLGKLENTLVVFLSDNGTFLGERSFAGKGPFNYDEITRVPLVMSWPAKIPANQTRRALVQSTDLAATLLAAAGVSKIPGSISSSFLDVARGTKKDEHRRSVFFQYHSQKNVVSRVRGVLKNGLKFSHYDGGNYFSETAGTDALVVPLVPYNSSGYELYNLEDDPNELVNLLPYRGRERSALWTALSNSDHRDVINDLLRTMADFQTVTRDDLGLELADIQVDRRGQKTAEIRWKSVRRAHKSKASASTEVVYTRNGCHDCPIYEIDHKINNETHRVVLTNLVEGAEYQALLFSIGGSGNGGMARVLIPATPSAGGPGVGHPRLSYIWKDHTTVVLERSGPFPWPRDHCVITSQTGRTLTEYRTERGICLDECRLRQDTNPGRLCSWGSEIFRKP